MSKKISEQGTIKVHDTVADMMHQVKQLGGIHIRDRRYDQASYIRQVLN